jgi:hypothetical protein
LISASLFQKLVQSKVLATALFCLIGLGYMWKSGYARLTFERPGSIHQWRQCDGPSLALNYYQDGNSFWEPAMHNQLNGEGKAGGELPILYYGTAQLYFLFGPHEFLLRLIHLGIFLLGLFVLFFAFLKVCPIPFLAPIPFLLFWSSPTLLFYTNNFLPDGPALGFALLGVGLIWLSSSLEKRYLFYFGGIAFAFAALIKVSMLIPFIAMLMIGLGFSIFKPWKDEIFFKKFNPSALLTILIIVFLPSLIWYNYIRLYNAENGGVYFSTAIKPVWESTLSEVLATYEAITNVWLHLLWPPLTLILICIGVIVFLAIGIQQWKKPAWMFVLITFLGSGAYGLVFFTPLVDHDYYYLAFMIAPLLAMIYVTHELSKWIKQKLTISLAVMILFAVPVLSFASLHSSANLMWGTYMDWFDKYTYNQNLNDIEPWLQSHGITYQDKVISLPDFSSNQSLYLMNRKGWTGLTGIYNTDDADNLIKQGAQYVVVTDTSFYSITFLQYHITDTIGYHGNIGVYKIDKSRWADF